MSMSEKQAKENYDRGRIIRTTNIDTFMNCDTEVPEAKNSASNDPMEDEEDPLWDDVDVSTLKKASPNPKKEMTSLQREKEPPNSKNSVSSRESDPHLSLISS